MKVCPQCQHEYAVDVDFCPSDGTKLRARREDGEDPLIGRALDGRWVIEAKLGEGGMGAVYRGHQKSVSRTVAIKTLRPQLVDSDEFVDRFFREAKIAATISHPNSVTILDYGESDGTLYLAMEFLDGQLLTDRIDAGGVPIRQVLEIGIQVASALSAAHDRHIVHRDLKPDNIFLLDVPGGATFVKVLDFGIAKMLDSKTQVTKTGMIFGTPEYMSPEQCRGDVIDGRSDLYSLGCILYELIGGRTPFRGTTPMAVLMAHVNQAAPALAPDGTAAHVPYDVEQVIMRLLAKRPDDRFASAGELRDTLEAILHSLENPNNSGSRPVLRPVPSREIVAPAVNIGFDATMGLAPTGPAEEPEPRRVRSDTDAIVEPRAAASKTPLIVLAVVVFALVAVAACLVLLLASPRDHEVQAQIEPVVEKDPIVIEPIVAEPATADTPDAGSDASQAVAASSAEDVVPDIEAEPKPKKAKPKKAAAAKAEPAAEPVVVAMPEPKPEPQPEPKAEPKPEVKAEPKPEPKKKAADKINEKAEKTRDNIVKGVDRKLNKALDDLLN